MFSQAEGRNRVQDKTKCLKDLLQKTEHTQVSYLRGAIHPQVPNLKPRAQLTSKFTPSVTIYVTDLKLYIILKQQCGRGGCGPVPTAPSLTNHREQSSNELG